MSSKQKKNRLVKQVANGRVAHFLHPDLKNRLGLVDKPHSSATQSDIISQDSNQSQTDSRQKQIADMKERVKNALNKGALSPQTPNKDKEMER